MKVKELLHAAYLLGCWSAVERLCINFCQANGLKTEWIRELKAKGGRQSVTLANLQNYRKRFRDSEKRRGQQPPELPPSWLCSPLEEKDRGAVAHFGIPGTHLRVQNARKKEKPPSCRSDASTAVNVPGVRSQATVHTQAKAVSPAFHSTGLSVGGQRAEPVGALADACDQYVDPQHAFLIRGYQRSPTPRGRPLVDTDGSTSASHMPPPVEYDCLGGVRRQRTKKRGSRARISAPTRGKRKRGETNALLRQMHMPDIPLSNADNPPLLAEDPQAPAHAHQQLCYFVPPSAPAEQIMPVQVTGDMCRLSSSFDALPRSLDQTADTLSSGTLHWPAHNTCAPTSPFPFHPYGASGRLPVSSDKAIRDPYPPPCLSVKPPNSADAFITLGENRSLEPGNTVLPSQAARAAPAVPTPLTVVPPQGKRAHAEPSSCQSSPRERSCSTDSWRTESLYSHSSKSSSDSTSTTSTSSEEGELSSPCSTESWKTLYRKRRMARQVNFAGKKPRHSKIPVDEPASTRTEVSLGPALSPMSSTIAAGRWQRPTSCSAVFNQADPKAAAVVSCPFTAQADCPNDTGAPRDPGWTHNALPALAGDSQLAYDDKRQSCFYSLPTLTPVRMPPSLERQSPGGDVIGAPFPPRNSQCPSSDPSVPTVVSGEGAQTSSSPVEARSTVADNGTCEAKRRLRAVSGERQTSSVFADASHGDTQVSQPDPLHVQRCLPSYSAVHPPAKGPPSTSRENDRVGQSGFSAALRPPPLLNTRPHSAEGRNIQQPELCTTERPVPSKMDMGSEEESARRLDYARPGFHIHSVTCDSALGQHFSEANPLFRRHSRHTFDCESTRPATEYSSLPQTGAAGPGRPRAEKYYGTDMPVVTSVAECKSGSCSGVQTKEMWKLALADSFQRANGSDGNYTSLTPEKTSYHLCLMPPPHPPLPDLAQMTEERSPTSSTPDATPVSVLRGQRAPANVLSDAGPNVAEKVVNCVGAATEAEYSGMTEGTTQVSIASTRCTPNTREARGRALAHTGCRESSSFSCEPKPLACGWKGVPSTNPSANVAANAGPALQGEQLGKGLLVREPIREFSGRHISGNGGLLETRYQFCCGDPDQPATVRLTVRSPFT
ncbi:hypothetical protein BESB_021000 [Besnoitia besnoiti]|uniref:Uncharacterized protein n=1 Tax=Besnoitia besnoiti TaxID=94643 RepID=A0A2A9M2H4_BESBE|nr:hypothetical protein BESB_021000 [Besnoitia besnoiti]PFH32159.1 hypothetical protein BESB_021000 [Besnoitia besnoiti]